MIKDSASEGDGWGRADHGGNEIRHAWDGIGCSDLRAVIRRRCAQRRTCGGAVPLAAAQGVRVKIKRQGSITLGGSEKIAQRLVGIAQCGRAGDL